MKCGKLCARRCRPRRSRSHWHNNNVRRKRSFPFKSKHITKRLINPSLTYTKTAICTILPERSFVDAIGFCNASSTFQRFIDEVTRDLPFVYAFVDDFARLVAEIMKP
ncbi:hypothetical protein TNCV_2052371 [Trichonephila clavipes]|nr:hypothetical protein TNCV_2052371 [Trichonephila clavipes]